MTEPQNEDDDDDGARQRNFVLALLAVIVIVVIGFFLVWKMWQNEKMQECLLTGRRDCAPIDIPDSR
ncbi:MAG TPA: hypothetical protein VGK90_13930 [Rhizomicrobium sp.]|jgi:uncharacterized membrane protein